MQNISIKDYENEIENLKNKIDSFRPFSTEQLENLQSWFKISFTAESNAIEWNTFTQNEVKILVEDWITVWWKTIKEVKETQNLASIVDIIWQFFETDFILTSNFILELHKKLLFWIDEKYAWKYRDIQLFISWSSDIPSSYKDLEKLLDIFIKSTNLASKNPLESIARLHYDFVKIHPFTDWNGRIARLLMNLYFVKNWYLPVIFPVATRLDYIKSLWWDKNFDDFYRYFLWQTRENMINYLRMFE